MNWSLYHYIMTFFTFCCSFGLKVYFLWLGTAISAFFCFPYMWSISFHTFILTQCVPFLFFCLFVFLSALHDLWDLRSSTKDWTHVLGVKAWSLNHWTSREFPQCVSLQLKWRSYRQHIVGFWFFLLFHSVTVCLPVGEFNPFTFKLFIDRCGLSMAILSISGPFVVPLFLFSYLPLWIYDFL